MAAVLPRQSLRYLDPAYADRLPRRLAYPLIGVISALFWAGLILAVIRLWSA